MFESFVVSELYKNFLHRGVEPDLYFWRDAAGHEVDLVIDSAGSLTAIEARSAQTVAADFFDGLSYLADLAGEPAMPRALVYAGDRTFRRDGVTVYRWSDL